jgi:hypothetical protein
MKNQNTRDQAKRLASHGRNGDSTLVHMHPREVQALSGIASLAGRKLTKNPKTGMTEAFNLFDILPLALNFIPGIGTAASIALSAASGAASAAVEGNDPLSGALMGGLTGGVGAAIGGPASAATGGAESLMNAGGSAAANAGMTGLGAAEQAALKAGQETAMRGVTNAASELSPGMLQDVFGAGTDAGVDNFLSSMTTKENLPWLIGGAGALAGSGLFDQTTDPVDNQNAKANLRKPGPPRMYNPIQNQPGMSLNDYGTYGQMGSSMPYEGNFFTNNPGPYTGDPYEDDPKYYPFAHGGMVDRYAFGGSVAPPAGSGPQAQTQSSQKAGNPWQASAGPANPMAPSSGMANNYGGGFSPMSGVMQQAQPVLPQQAFARGGSVKKPKDVGDWWAGGGNPPNQKVDLNALTSDGKKVSNAPAISVWSAPASQPSPAQIAAARDALIQSQGPTPSVKLFEPVRGYALGGGVHQNRGAQNLGDGWWRGESPTGAAPIVQADRAGGRKGVPVGNAGGKGTPGSKAAEQWAQNSRGMPYGFVQKVNAKHAAPMQPTTPTYNRMTDPNFRDTVGWQGNNQTATIMPVGNPITAVSNATSTQPVNNMTQAGGPAPQVNNYQPVSGFARGGGISNLQHTAKGPARLSHYQALMAGKRSHHGRKVPGSGGGMDDTVPARVDGSQPAALSSGEYVIPADVVGHLGDGNTDAGSRHLDAMVARTRMAKSGNATQPGKLNHRKVMPA